MVAHDPHPESSKHNREEIMILIPIASNMQEEHGNCDRIQDRSCSSISLLIRLGETWKQVRKNAETAQCGTFLSTRIFATIFYRIENFKKKGFRGAAG